MPRRSRSIRSVCSVLITLAVMLSGLMLKPKPAQAACAKPIPFTASQIGVSEGGNKVYAIRGSNQEVWAWGQNWIGQLGDNTTNARTHPVQVLSTTSVPTLAGIAAVEPGTYAAYAVTTNGELLTWGQNASREFGNGTTTSNLSKAGQRFA